MDWAVGCEGVEEDRGGERDHQVSTRTLCLRAIIDVSSVLDREDDKNWPKKNIVGKQELEIRIGSDHIAFETAKIGSLVDIQDSEDPEGLRVFYYLVQDLKVRLLIPPHACPVD